MNSEWKKEKLGTFLLRAEDTIDPVSDTEYREITVRLWGKGVIERGRTKGAQLAGRRFVAREGQFIMSRIDARNGAAGIVPTSLDGALVTNDFPLFEINVERILPSFLGWLCKTSSFVELCQRASEGTTNRVRLQEERFLALDVMLPSLSEQKRLLYLLETVDRKIREAQTLRREALKEGQMVLRSILAHDKNAQPTPMGRLLKQRSTDVIVRADEKYHFAGVYCFGRGVFKGEIKSGMQFAYSHLTRIRAGEFIYPKLMAWEGAFGVVPSQCEGCVVSPEFPVFEVFEDLVFPEVLNVYFSSPSVWPEISRASTGTNVRRRRLNPKDFLAYEMPLPCRETQLKLRAAYAEIERLRSLQAETAAELDVLLPSVLSKAFSGEL